MTVPVTTLLSPDLLRLAGNNTDQVRAHRVGNDVSIDHREPFGSIKVNVVHGLPLIRRLHGDRRCYARLYLQGYGRSVESMTSSLAQLVRYHTAGRSRRPRSFKTAERRRTSYLRVIWPLTDPAPDARHRRPVLRIQCGKIVLTRSTRLVAPPASVTAAARSLCPAYYTPRPSAPTLPTCPTAHSGRRLWRWRDDA